MKISLEMERVIEEMEIGVMSYEEDGVDFRFWISGWIGLNLIREFGDSE